MNTFTRLTVIKCQYNDKSIFSLINIMINGLFIPTDTSVKVK